MRFSFFAVLAFILSFVMSQPAKADYFVWQDDQTGLSFSFPDTWQIVSNHESNDLVTVMPPSGRAHAACRVRASDDGRFMIYPPRYSVAVQHVHYSRNFWESYLQEYSNPKILAFHDGAGLGRGFASYAVAEYESAVQGPYMDRKSLMFVSHYNDKTYVLECSSHKEAFIDWKRMFLSVAGSIDFKKVDYEMATGRYRNFLKDGRLIFKGAEGDNAVYY